MRHGVGNLLETEYSNAVNLIGIDDDEANTELFGKLNKLNPVDRHVAWRKLNANTLSKGSRLEFEKHFMELPPHIKELLREEKLRLADMLIYAIKPLTSTVTKMFREQDVIQVSISNISNSHLPKNMALLVSGIYLLQGQAASLDTEDIKSVVLDSIGAIPALANGEFTLRSNKKHLIVENSNHCFVDGSKTAPKGYLKLNNPRLITEDQEIELEIEIGTTKGIPPNTFLYAGLHGTATIP